jgi:tetratricopeptide (TPR) repeat protein
LATTNRKTKSKKKSSTKRRETRKHKLSPEKQQKPGGNGSADGNGNDNGNGDDAAPGRAADYYDVLGVRKDGSPEEIRASFRRLAKKYHPDRNTGRAKWAEQKIRVIIQAYDTLMDRDARAAYDRKLRQELDPDEDAYRQSLRQRYGDPYAEARLVLEDLLNERGDEAVEVFERARDRAGDFDLSKYLDSRDYLDCLFLLGEEYERAGDWKQALELYHKVYDLERDSPSRFFLETLKERIRDIYCKKLARRSTPLDAVDVYERVLSLGIPKKTEAYIHKKIAEAFFRAALHKKAKLHLSRAFTLEPKLKGAQKICEKLGLDIRKERSRATAGK